MPAFWWDVSNTAVTADSHTAVRTDLMWAFCSYRSRKTCSEQGKRWQALLYHDSTLLTQHKLLLAITAQVTIFNQKHVRGP